MTSKRLVLTTAELALMLGVSKITIHRWRRSGKLPKPRFDGRKKVWLAQAIDDWLANNETG